MAKQQNNGQEQDVNQLRKVRREKLADLQQNGKDPFQITKFNQTHHSLEVKSLYEAHEAELLKDHQTPDVEGMNEEQAKEVLKKDYEERRSIMDANPIHVSIAGRMMFKRVMGKASFCNIQDLQGSIQVYVARDAIGTDSYTDFKRSDIGDIFGLEGFAFRTRTGEISIHAEKMTLLSKSLQILPEKFHGLTDTDTRYRQRYVDLIMNPESKETFIKRSKIIKEIRNFLDGRGFMEVETPMLVSNAGGAAARPFETHYNALNEDVKLRISLELYLKRLIVGGLERVYEIGRVFRNEGVDTRHNPEFTLMELYQAYTDYEGMMELTESMFRYLAEKVCGSAVISYNGTVIDMAKPFERISMIDAVKKYAGVDFAEVKTDEEAKALADEHHVEYEERHKKGDILNLFFDEFCEEKMIQPTFVTDHPIEISPLTKKNPEDPNYVERFELYVYGREMCNAYSELNDPIDQRERFAAQEEAFAAGDEEANHTDEDFLNALEIGMPPTGGIGYGIDRLVMLLTDAQAIRDVLLFPTMNKNVRVIWNRKRSRRQMEAKKKLLTYAGLKALEDELENLKVVKRREIAQKIKEAREQGDLSENAEYDAAKDEQRDIEARIEELEAILKNAEVVVEDEVDFDKINIGCTVKVFDITFDEEMEFKLVGSTEANSLEGKISNESPVGQALMGKQIGDVVTVETQAGVMEYKVLDISRSL